VFTDEDAFTVTAEAPKRLGIDDELLAAVKRRVRRFAAAARVNGDLALALPSPCGEFVPQPTDDSTGLVRRRDLEGHRPRK
jgi:hypothetical protein